MNPIASAKLFCKFEDLLLLDEISTQSLVVNGDTPSLSPSLAGLGLQMSPNSYLTTSQSLGITSSFTIGFWLKPTNPGMAVTPGNTPIPLRVSLLSKSAFTTSGGTTTASQTSFYLFEQCLAGGQNCLSVAMKGTSTSATVVSAEYSPDVWHYFWIVYNGASGWCKIYVDGSSVGTTTSGVVPPALSSSTAPLAINYGVDGSSYNVASNTGVLDDLFILNAAIDDTTVMSRAIGLGADYVLDQTLANVDEVQGGILLNDPTTIQITGVANNNSEIYLGRSDGKVLRGYRSLWKCRRSWDTEAEASELEQSLPTGSVSVVNGLLKPTVMIRA